MPFFLPRLGAGIIARPLSILYLRCDKFVKALYLLVPLFSFQFSI